MLMEKPASLSFTEMSKLTKLDISYNSFVDDEIITSIVKECEALENINLSRQYIPHIHPVCFLLLYFTVCVTCFKSI